MLFNLPLDGHILIKLIYRSTLARSCQFKRKNDFIWLSQEYFEPFGHKLMTDELENFLSTEMSKRKPMEDLKDVKTGKITIFFSKERTETKERTVTGKSKLFITKFKFAYFTIQSTDGAIDKFARLSEIILLHDGFQICEHFYNLKKEAF